MENYNVNCSKIWWLIKQAIDAVPAMEEMLNKSFLSEKSRAQYKENVRDRAKALNL